jgi:hypothetical protein
MKTYDSVLEKTGRDDLARRAANAETAEPERGASPSGGGSSSGGGGGTSAPRPGTALDALRKAAETDASARANLFRIEADKNRRTERVSELMDGRFFSSAANTQLRAERDAERRAQDFMNRRAATAGLFTWEIPDLDNIPTRNMGELEKRFRQHNPFSTREDFDRFVRDQQKTPEERLREEEKAAEGRSGSGTSAADPMAAIMSFLTATFGDFKDRVPQNALTT